MTRQIQLLVGLVVVLATAMPATAQRVRDHRKRPRGPILSINHFTPRTGPVGTVVTVWGVGFTPRSRILVGGRPARIVNVQPKRLQFQIPPGAANGSVILRHPGVARDVRVGNFGIVVNLAVTHVAPNAGAPGTRVEIRGQGFRRGDQVLVSGQPLRVFFLGPRRIVAAIPPGARPGPVEVLRPGTNLRATGPMFNVLLPPPQIVRTTPASGTPGQRVRVEVNFLPPNANASYGRRPMRVLARGPNWIDVEIPRNARVGRFIVVKGPSGSARTATRFALAVPPVVTRIHPAYGLGGQRVEIHGQNFQPGDVVTLGGRPLAIDQLRGNLITVRIPRRAISGPLVVQRGALHAASPVPFEVIRRPRVRDIKPRFGRPGELVAIHGRALTPDAQVSYGAQALPIVRREGNRVLYVNIPRRASDQIITVTTRGGTAQAPAAFQVRRYPVLRSAAPARGIPGTHITLRGRRMRNATAVYLGNTPLTVVRRGRGELVVAVPDTAQSGRIDVVSYGERQATPFQFTVIAYPTITGFSPQIAYPGGQVTVTGMNFTATTQLFLGQQPLRIVQRQLPTRLVVQLPATASGSKFFWATDHGTRVRSNALFKIISPAALQGFSPARAKPGNHVTLSGVDMDRVVSVLVGSTQAHIVRRVDSRQLIIEVPPRTRAGNYHLWLRERTGTVRSSTKLAVLPTAIGRAMLPPAAPRGVTVRIRGQYFDGNTKASFRGVELPVVRVGKWGRVMWVRIPQAAVGAGSVIIDDGGTTSRVPGTFRILERPNDEPPPPPPPGRIRRH